MICGRTQCSTGALLVLVCVSVLVAATQAAADTISVAWDPGSDVGYKVHVGVQSGTYTQHFDVGSTTLFTFPNAVAGQRYCFVVSAYLLSSLLEGPNSAEVCGYSNRPPTLVNPGNRTSAVGQPVTLQLSGSDTECQPLTYSATGLPAGVSVQASTGFISGTGSTAGAYSVTARASDGALTVSQVFSWVMTAPTGDTTRPTVSISTPTSGTTTASTINFGGSASDNVGVTQVTWANGSGGSGAATGTTSWSAAGIPLVTGTNVITITARDAAGNSGTASMTVTRSATQPPSSPAPSTVALTVSIRKASKWRSSRLSWTTAPWSSVDVYRNGMRVTNTQNTGSYTDPVWSKGTYTYKICAAGSTTTCSNTVTVFF